MIHSFEPWGIFGFGFESEKASSIGVKHRCWYAYIVSSYMVGGDRLSNLTIFGRGETCYANHSSMGESGSQFV